MSERTSDGTQQPDPDPRQNQGNNPDRDESTGRLFSDPTAPIHDTPPTPPGATTGQQQAGQQPAQPPTPPMSNPYAQQPPAQPGDQATGQYGQQPGQPYPAYGQQQQPGQQPYPPSGQQQPGQQGQYPGYGQQYYATGAAETNVSAIFLTIVSALSMLGSFFLIGIPSLILGIMALTSNSTDPVGSRKKAKTGWIIFAANVVFFILLAIVAAIGLFVLTDASSNPDFSF
jgi:hypothetical protein